MHRPIPTSPAVRTQIFPFQALVDDCVHYLLAFFEKFDMVAKCRSGRAAFREVANHLLMKERHLVIKKWAYIFWLIGLHVSFLSVFFLEMLFALIFHCLQYFAHKNCCLI